MKRKILFFLTICLTTVCFCYGQDTTLLKRAPYKLTVVVDKKTVYEEDLKATAYILPDKTVQLYPGETIYIEVEQENGIIKSMKAVKEILDPTKTMTLSFTQTTEKKVHQMMMLKVTNPFKQQLVYHASIFLMNQKKWVTSNVYPVEAGLSSFESWPDIITSIALGNWVFTSK